MAIDHAREYDLAAAAAAQLRAAGYGDAVVAIQTGSGIPLPAMEEQRTLTWGEIEGFPRATAPGHRGALHHGLVSGVPTIVFDGRLHTYEGHEPAEVVRPIRAVGILGVTRLILTNAAGGVRPGLAAGDVVRITDHINLMGLDPLTGRHDTRFGERFPVMAGRAYSTRLGALAVDAAAEAGVALREGVYAAMRGPTFETAAEVRRLRVLGVDVVGMSTVPEVIAATQLGVATLVLSLVANPAGEVSEGQRAEEEVVEVAREKGGALMRVVEGVVRSLGTEVGP